MCQTEVFLLLPNRNGATSRVKTAIAINYLTSLLGECIGRGVNEKSGRGNLVENLV